MSKMYPIWNDVQACIYKSSKSYGVRNEGVVNIKVGTSKTILICLFSTEQQ